MSEPKTKPTQVRARLQLRWWWILLPIALAYAWDLGGHGFASLTELPAIFRAEAALGQAHDDLLRTPWLPNKLLEWGLAQTEADRVDLRDATHIRLRFPGLLSALLLVACAGIWARLRNATHAQAAWIALLCAAWPSTIAAVRSVSTTLWGDLGIVMMLLAVTRAYAPASSKRTSILSILFAGLGALLALHCHGMFCGLAFGLLIAATIVHRQGGRSWLWMVAACISLAVAALLVATQGEGFQPLLASAPDPGWIDTPLPRGLSDVLLPILSQWGLFALPIGCHFIYLRSSNAAVEWTWLILAVLIQAIWQTKYPAMPISAAVPGAYLLVSGFSRSSPLPAWQLRVLLAVGAMGVWAIAKEWTQSPATLLWPGAYANELADLPVEQLDALVGALRFELVLFAGLSSFILSIASIRRWRPNPNTASSQAIRASYIFGVALAFALIWHRSQTIHDELARLSSLRSLAEVAQDFQEIHPQCLGARFGGDDPGRAVYFQNKLATQKLTHRRDAIEWMHTNDARWLLVDRYAYATIAGELARSEIAVQEYRAGHPTYTWLANRESKDAPLRIQSALARSVPQLEHMTSVIFDRRLELLGWEFSEPVRRGQTAHLTLAFRVLKSVSPQAQYLARLQMGRISRANEQPQPFVDGLFLPSQWERGDIIVQRQSFDVSSILTYPGEHDLIVGIQPSKSRHYKITSPDADHASAAGLRFIGDDQEMIVVGTVTIE